LRKLGTASRKNKLYFAFRELGRVVRTTFLLEYIGDEDLRRIIQAAQNKCEGFNRFAQWAYFGVDTIAENVRDDQVKIIDVTRRRTLFAPASPELGRRSQPFCCRACSCLQGLGTLAGHSEAGLGCNTVRLDDFRLY